ncbi:PEP-CTERM sorting domain-containing protein [Massilia niastensis]|uniref:PEP-CTERM sorting domain-containing protein n=1 Tax=Massilia niastensis TaxID=544911 RepID=UPI000381318D|nr:PEP-CTERM sorting domain-containing protein [Massilia niastensis]
MTIPRAAVLALLLLSTPALADIYSRFSVRDLGYTLQDLDPNDGITPALSFGVPEGSWTGPWQAGARLDYFGLWPDDSPLWPDKVDQVSLEDVAEPGEFAGVAAYYGNHMAIGSGVIGGAVQDEMLSASADSVPGGMLAITAHTSGESAPFLFTLTPHTRVSFTAESSATIDTVPRDNYDDFLQATTALLLWNAGLVLSAQDRRSYAGGTGSGLLPHVDDTVTLSGSFDNRSAAPAYGAAQYRISLDTMSHRISPVPEPLPLAMLLAGGLLLAARRRRFLNA